MKKERSPLDERTRNRVQIDFNSAELENLTQLQQITGAPSRNTLIRDALSAYEWLLAKVAKNSGLHVPQEDLEAITRIRGKLRSTNLVDNNPHE